MDEESDKAGLPGFSGALEGFFMGLSAYETAAMDALKHIEEQLEKTTSIGISPWIPMYLFDQAAEGACISSKKFDGTEFEVNLKRFEASHPQGGQLVASVYREEEGDGTEVRIFNGDNFPKDDRANQSITVCFGPHHFGRVHSYDEADGVLRALASMAELLPKEPPITALADMYYDLKGQRDRLLELLSPMVVEKWLMDGRCEWCPDAAV